jgi:hypothetical protein
MARELYIQLLRSEINHTQVIDFGCRWRLCIIVGLLLWLHTLHETAVTLYPWVPSIVKQICWPPEPERSWQCWMQTNFATSTTWVSSHLVTVPVQPGSKAELKVGGGLAANLGDVNAPVQHAVHSMFIWFGVCWLQLLNLFNSVRKLVDDVADFTPFETATVLLQNRVRKVENTETSESAVGCRQEVSHSSESHREF